MIKLSLNDLSYEPRDVEFNGAMLKIKPVPLSECNFTVTPQGDMKIAGAEQCRIFKKALVGWSGVVGSDGAELPCTDEIKQKVFDFGLAGLGEFVITTVMGLNKQRTDAEKNS